MGQVILGEIVKRNPEVGIAIDNASKAGTIPAGSIAHSVVSSPGNQTPSPAAAIGGDSPLGDDEDALLARRKRRWGTRSLLGSDSEAGFIGG